MKCISVVLPCYNVEKYIDKCINSLVNQTIGIDKLELIFVDDASTDATYEKLCQWEKRYPDSILVIHCLENRKQGAARNIGMEYASADYIGFVDSDDWIEPDMYETLYEKAILTGADVVSCMYQREDEEGKRYDMGEIYRGEMDVLCEVSKEEFYGLPGGVWSGLYSKRLIMENDIYFPENLAYEDNFFGALLQYYMKSYYVIDKVFYHYTINNNSTIMQKNATHHNDRLIIEKMKLHELKKRGFYEKYKDEIDFEFLRLYYINTVNIFFTRMDEIPYETLCSMQREVFETIPDFENNSHLEELHQVELLILRTIKMKLSVDDWRRIKNSYLHLISL